MGFEIINNVGPACGSEVIVTSSESELGRHFVLSGRITMLKSIKRAINDFYRKDLESGGITGTIILLAVAAVFAGLGFGLSEYGKGIIKANERPYRREQIEYQERMADVRKDILKILSERNQTPKLLPQQIDAEDAAALEKTDDVYLFYKYQETEKVLKVIELEHKTFDKTEAGKEAKGKRFTGKVINTAGKVLLYPAVFLGVILIVQLIILPFSLK